MSLTSKFFVVILVIETTQADKACQYVYRKSPGYVSYPSSRSPLCQVFLAAPQQHYILVNVTRVEGLDFRPRIKHCPGLEIVQIYPWGGEVRLAQFCRSNETGQPSPRVFHSDTSLLKLTLSGLRAVTIYYTFRDKCPAYCNDGGCLPSRSLLCNRVLDCSDHSDEAHCPPRLRGQGHAKIAKGYKLGRSKEQIRPMDDSVYPSQSPQVEGTSESVISSDVSTQSVVVLADSQGATLNSGSLVSVSVIACVLGACSTVLALTLGWLACTGRLGHRRYRLAESESGHSVQALPSLDDEVVYVPSMAVQCPRSCHRDQPSSTHLKPARSRSRDERWLMSAESGSLPVMSDVDLPPHIPLSKDGEELYPASQAALSQHLLASDYSGESVRAPPNRTVRPAIAEQSPPPYRTHSRDRCPSPSGTSLKHGSHRHDRSDRYDRPTNQLAPRTRTYSDSRRHSRNDSDSSRGSSRSEDFLPTKSRTGPV